MIGIILELSTNLASFYGKNKIGLPLCSLVKNLPANKGDVGSIPWSRRSPEEGNNSPFQYSCLGTLMDRGARQVTVLGFAKEVNRT